MIGPAANNALDAKAVLADRKRLFTLFRDLQLGDTKEWLVKGLLGHGEASAFYGKPGDGKSVLVQDLCMHVAAGWPWHDRPVRRGAVVYIALERRKLVERRALAFRQRHDILIFRSPSSAASMTSVIRGRPATLSRSPARSRRRRPNPSS